MSAGPGCAQHRWKGHGAGCAHDHRGGAEGCPVHLRWALTVPSLLSGVTYAAKGYFDALVKMGELASESQGSKELGKTPDAAGTPRRLSRQMCPRGSGVPSCAWS